MEDKELVIRRANNAVISRDFNLAIRLYKSLLQGDVKNLEYLNALGNLYVKAGDDAKALPYFQQILTFYQNNFEAMNSMGAIYRRMGKYQESIDILQKALDTGVNSSQVNYNLGFTYKSMGNYEDALECFENVISTNPTDVLVYNHIGAIHAAQNDHAKAVASYKRGLQIDPNHPILQFNMAKSLQAMNDDGAAIQAYETALRAKPGWQDAVIAYSELLLNHRKTKTAGELVQNAIGLHPQDAGLYLQMGHILMRQNNYEKAASSYEIANRLASGNADTLRELARAFEKLGKTEESVARIKEAQKLKPEDSDIKKAAAHVMLSANQYADAEKIINELNENTKDDEEVLDLQGQYSILTDNEAESDSCAEKIKALNPEYAAYLYSYASRYVQKGNYVTAKEKIKAYIDENMKDVPAWILLGQIDEALGNSADALDDYSTAVAFDPNNYLAGDLAKKIGDKIDSEVNAMQEADAPRSVELDSAEEISLDEFGISDDSDSEIVPDETIPDPNSDKTQEEGSTEGLKEEDNTDVLGMDDVTSLFETSDEDEGLPLEEPLTGPDPEEEETEKTEEDEDKEETESAEDENQNSADGNIDIESIPEPFPDMPVEDLTDDFDDRSLDSLLGEMPDDESEESSAEETSSVAGNSDNSTASENSENATSEKESESDNQDENDFSDVFDDMGFSEKTPAAQSPVTPERVIQPEEVRVMNNYIPSPSPAISEISKAAEKAQASAEEASTAAEKSWMAAQNAADMMQSAEEAGKIIDEKVEEASKKLEEQKDAAIEEIQRSARAEQAYDKLVNQVGDMLPRLTLALDDPAEVEKFKKEIELFKRLRQLGESLPFEQRAKFLAGRVRLLLDYIIARLSGRPGLMKAASAIREKENLPVDGSDAVSCGNDREDIVNVLRHMESLTFYLEDENLAKALMVAAEEVIEKLN